MPVSRFLPVLAAGLALGAGPAATASAPDDGACDIAAQDAAAAAGVPLDLLRAITRVETGRGTPPAPWPWTVNSRGRGYWFPNRQAAVDFANAELAAGRADFDVGCFQMNLRWHRRRFASLEEMFDPRRNAAAAAAFLGELRAESGNWTDAAGAYHSREPDRRQSYLRRIADLLSPSAGAAMPPPAAAPRGPNRFPLLAGGVPSGAGSLVPVLTARARLIGND